ncbi:hypothetical protein ACU4GD_34435 [Cupriavidus basilensis]
MIHWKRENGWLSMNCWTSMLAPGEARRVVGGGRLAAVRGAS